MTDTEKSTGAYEPYSGRTEGEEKRPEKEQEQEQVRETYQDIKEKTSETAERFSESWPEAAEETRQAAREAGRKAADTGAAAYEAISENIFPIVLTGIGAAWLTASLLRRRSETRIVAEFEPESSQWTEEATSRLGETSEALQERTRKIRERAGEGMRRTMEKSKGMLSGKTLYVAGALAAAGLVVGLSIPDSGTEQKIFNEVRNKIREEAERSEKSEAKGEDRPEEQSNR